jgi:RNA polymerase sigma-70 factor (ECF subfamily)
MANPAPHFPAPHAEEKLAQDIERLFREHYRGLCAVVRDYVHSLDAAEEIVQEIFLRVWDNCRRGEAPPTRAYLYTAARNHAVSVLRHERVVQSHEEMVGVAEESVAESTVLDELEADELTIAARSAIAKLPDKCRRVFVLSRERELTYAEIAQVLGISVKTVELHMTRAFKALRAELRKLA